MTPFLYPGHVAAGAEQCTPCWQSLPTWPEETCAIGEPACVNFPGVEAVLTHVELLLKEPTTGQMCVLCGVEVPDISSHLKAKHDFVHVNDFIEESRKVLSAGTSHGD